MQESQFFSNKRVKFSTYDSLEDDGIPTSGSSQEFPKDKTRSNKQVVSGQKIQKIPPFSPNKSKDIHDSKLRRDSFDNVVNNVCALEETKDEIFTSSHLLFLKKESSLILNGLLTFENNSIDDGESFNPNSTYKWRTVNSKKF